MSKYNLVFFSSDEEIQRLCENYWSLDSDLEFEHKTKYLADEFGISTNKITKSVNENCYVESTEISCQDCNKKYIYSSRSDFQEKQRLLNRYLNNWKCQACIEEERKRAREEEEERKRQYKNIIKESYPNHPYVLNLENISLEDIVYLLSFIRLNGSEDLTFAYPLNVVNATDKLSPKSDLDYEIIVQLFHHNIIRVHPDSSIECFDGEKAEQFYPSKVLWILPISSNSNDTKGLIEEIEEVLRKENLPSRWNNERVGLWKKIALNECLEYLAYALSEHNLTIEPGEKTITVINGLLEDFSVSQIYTFIWRAAKDAAAFLVRTGTYKKHAANTVVGKIQRDGERAKAENWNVSSYRRNFNCPQSLISQVLFNTVLKIGEMGFNKSPSNAYLTNDMDDIDESDVIQ